MVHDDAVVQPPAHRLESAVGAEATKHADPAASTELREFAAHVVAARWDRRWAENLDDVVAFLEAAGAEHVARLDAGELYHFWRDNSHAPAERLRLMALVPQDVHRLIRAEHPLEVYYPTTREGSLIGHALDRLDEADRRTAEATMLRRWKKRPGDWLARASLLPASLSARVPADLVRQGWALTQQATLQRARDVLVALPAVLQAHLPEDSFEQLLQSHDLGRLRRPGDGFIDLANLPDRFVTAGVAEFVRNNFFEAAENRVWMQAHMLRALVRATPAIRALIPREAAQARWSLVAQDTPDTALELLGALPAEYLPTGLSANDVEQIWYRHTAARPLSIGDIALLSRVPAHLRDGADPGRLQAQKPAETEWGEDVLDILSSIAPDLRPCVGEAVLERQFDLSAEHLVRPWLYDQMRRMRQGAAVWPELLCQAFLCCAHFTPRSALHWLALLEEPVQRLIPESYRMQAWRSWAAKGDTRGADERHLGDALMWAGYDTEAAQLLTSQDALHAPAALRPSSPDTELALAILEAVECGPAEGLSLLARIPAEIRPALDPVRVQEAWEGFHADGRYADALTLLELAPPEIRPTPTRAQFAELLQAPDAEVRLTAIRLHASLEAGPRAAEQEETGRRAATDNAADRTRSSW
jgi:hypothetical protein